MARTSPDPEGLRANVIRIQVMSFTWMFLVFMPIFVPYLAVHDLGIDRVYQLQAIFAIAVVALEVPSGYVSDLLGRKGCLIVAGLLHGVAFSVFAASSTFTGFALFEILGAVAVSLYSGSDVALLYDSLEALDDHAGRRRLLGRRLMWMQGGETLAALLAAGLLAGGFSLADVAAVNAAVGWTPFLIALGLVEVPRRRLDRGKHLENLRSIWREIFHRSALLRLVMLNLILYGLATLVAVWAFQAYWIFLEISVTSFGILWAAYNLTVAVVGRVAHRLEVSLGAVRTVTAIGVLPVLGFAGMSLCATMHDGGMAWVVLGVLFGFCFQVSRGLTQVVIKDALNTRVPTEWRATANSISSLGVRLMFFVFGPTLGWLIKTRGHTVALAIYGGLFLVALLTLNRSLARALKGSASMSYHPDQT